MTYLLHKKFKGFIYYLKNLKDQSITNVKLKELMDAFYPYFNSFSFKPKLDVVK
jgi:hypothetical protein